MMHSKNSAQQKTESTWIGSLANLEVYRTQTVKSKKQLADHLRNINHFGVFGFSALHITFNILFWAVAITKYTDFRDLSGGIYLME